MHLWSSTASTPTKQAAVMRLVSSGLTPSSNMSAAGAIITSDSRAWASAALAAVDSPDSTALWGGPYPYPPLPALLATPLTVLPFQAAGLVVMGVLVCVALAVPYVLGVRDWRCYGLLLVWPSTMQAIQTATVNAADLLGWADRVGSVQAGRFADIVAVSGDPLADIHELERVRGRRHVGEVELRDLRDGVEDRGQLLAETVDLLLGQVEVRKLRDVQDLFSRDRHRENPSRKTDGPFRGRRRLNVVPEKLRSGCGDVRGLSALGALHDLELHLLPLGEGLVAVHRDRGEVDEDVLATLTLDEPVTLLVREPLNGALSQLCFLLAVKRRPGHRAADLDKARET